MVYAQQILVIMQSNNNSSQASVFTPQIFPCIPPGLVHLSQENLSFSLSLKMAWCIRRILRRNHLVFKDIFKVPGKPQFS